jgi:holin-like protein
MIRDLAALLACQLAGEVIARGAGLPVPGPVLGMLLMVGVLLAMNRLAVRHDGAAAAMSSLGSTADRLLASLGLLFVPAGVGIVRHLDLLAEHGPALAAALAGSLVVTMIVTVGAFLAASRVFGGTPDERHDA